MTIEDLLRLGPVVPVIVIDDARKAVPLARALVAGGVRALEVTLRTEAAFDSIDRIARDVPDAVVGVGTITRPEEFGRARQAGARFTVTPGLTPDLVSAAGESGLPLLPGVMTPRRSSPRATPVSTHSSCFRRSRRAASAC